MKIRITVTITLNIVLLCTKLVHTYKRLRQVLQVLHMTFCNRPKHCMSNQCDKIKLNSTCKASAGKYSESFLCRSMWSCSVAKSQVQIPGMHQLYTYKDALIQARFVMLWLITNKHPI